VGDKVVVALLNRGMALSSVVMGYLLPLVVLLATLLLLKAIGLEDGVVALGAIGAVALYYLLLYILRREIEKKIEFTIFKE
jgi:sigma-E factor negative regulatory protein RseC